MERRETKMNWVAFSYREFWDRPRAILMHTDHGLIFMESMFLDEIDDYDPMYHVYRMPPIAESVLAGSWEKLANLAEKKIGIIPVNKVKFDETSRKKIDINFLNNIQ